VCASLTMSAKEEEGGGGSARVLWGQVLGGEDLTFKLGSRSVVILDDQSSFQRNNTLQ